MSEDAKNTDIVRGKGLNGSAPGVGAVTPSVIDHVGVTVEAFLGDAVLTVAELQACKVGSVIPLGATLNELVELRVNSVKIAHGELVAVGDNFGVRITHLAS